MIEIPEAITLSKQINDTLKGKQIKRVIANASPHKFAWFFKNPDDYEKTLYNKTITGSKAYGGFVEIQAEDAKMCVSDGINLRYFNTHQLLTKKHQLLIEFDDCSHLIASVQMYGGLWAFLNDEFDNPYLKIAKEKISPLSDDFTLDYFKHIAPYEKMSVKAYLATLQHFPGLGNGVVQDILWHARLHPKRKMTTLTEGDELSLFQSVKKTLEEMTKLDGRDTEKTLLGENGGYKTILSKNTVLQACPRCGHLVKKEAYLGGSIYFCESCQE